MPNPIKPIRRRVVKPEIKINTNILDLIKRIPVSPTNKKPLLPGSTILGFGYDIQGTEYGSSFKSSLFDMSKIQVKDLDTTGYSIYPFATAKNEGAGTFFSSIHGVTAVEYQKKITHNAGIGGGISGFSASVNLKYSTESMKKSDNTFYTINYADKRWYANLDLQKFKNYLMPDVRAMIENGDPAMLFQVFGTHFVCEVTIGAKIMLSLVANKYSNLYKKDVTVNAKANFEEFIKTDYDHESHTQNQYGFDFNSLNIEVLGGAPDLAGIGTLNTANSDTPKITTEQYEKWIQSINENNLTSIDLKLMPLWHFCSDQQRAKYLEEYAVNHYSSKVTEVGEYPQNTYHIVIKTGDIEDAGTDSDIHITLYGEYGEISMVLDNEDPNFEQGNADVFETRSKDIGNISSIKIIKNNAGNKPDWYLANVDIYVNNDPVDPKNPNMMVKELQPQFSFTCNKWFSTVPDELTGEAGELVRIFYR